ncbi:MAG: LysR family transcriptional regulator [Bacilli bacterium]|nr:LysR family transcriptional regulator [Bacilli bacterium]
MNLEYLHNFVTIVDEGTILKASKKLFIAQPSLSNQIKYLENIYKAPLLIRGGRKISLTEQGKVFYSFAKKVSRAYEASLQDISEIKKGNSGVLRVAIPPTVYRDLMQKNFVTFTKKYPNMRFDIYELSSTHAEEAIKNGECELAITNATIRNSNLFEIRVISTETFKVYIPQSNSMYTKENISIDDLHDLKVVLPRAYIDTISSYCNEKGFNLNIDSTTTTSIGSIEMAIVKNIIAIVPLPDEEQISKDCLLKNLICDHESVYTRKVIWSKSKPLSPAGENFLKCLLSSSDNLKK